MSSIPDVSKVNYNGVLYNVKDAVTRGKMDEVDAARQQAIQDIQAEGQTQTGAVTAEGTAQKNAVTAEGTRVLGTIPSDYTALAGDVSDIDAELFDTEKTSVTPTFVDNYGVDIREGHVGELAYGTNWKYTTVNCAGYDFVETQVHISTIGANNGVVFADDNNVVKSYYACPVGEEVGVTDITYEVPEGATKIKISVYKPLQGDSFYVRLVKNNSVIDGIESDIEQINTELGELHDEVNDIVTMPEYMMDLPVKPLLAEMMADFAWCSMVMPAAFTGKNVVITVSGNADSNQLTASAITPDGLSISDVGTNWVGGVISADGVNFSVCNFKYVSENTIEVFPALEESITDGVLSTLMYDSGASYVGLHLTENGYKAYMQNLYAKNPKHCEVGKYIARFRPETDTTSPFTWYGGTIPAAQYRFITANKNLRWLQNPTSKFYGYQYSTSWAAHTTKSGAYWEVDLQGKSGYLEAYIFAICSAFELPQDQELHIVVTIDGVEKLNKVVSDSICRRIVVDYENATTGRLEVYSNKWYKVDNNPYGFGFGRVTWWVNELEYPNTVMFPKGAVIAQEFDSWGVFHDGASGVEMERLHNAATGVSVPYTNHSKGDQTSAWGKAWFYENVWKYNPSICIHDFVINDTNSADNAGIPATIEGPDEVEYNNKLTSAQYADNMILLGKLAMANGIQPIFMRACQHGSTNYYTFTNALIDAMSLEV